MQTKTIAIRVNAEVAKIFEAASEEQRRKLEAFRKNSRSGNFRQFAKQRSIRYSCFDWVYIEFKGE
jgi:hypothetical protein